MFEHCRSNFPNLPGRGFSLIELMVVVAIVAILSTIAMPSYTDYVTRGRIPDATSNLANKRVQVEQFFQDSQTYVGAPACVADTTSSQYFDFSCPVQAPTVFTLRALGKGSMTGFTYTVDQNNGKVTVAVPAAPAGWATAANCWVTKKGGVC